MIFLQIESAEGAINVRDIGMLYGLDAIMFGPNDFSFTLEATACRLSKRGTTAWRTLNRS